MNRRQFAFWIGAGLFGLGSRLRAESLDSLTAFVMCCTESCVQGKTCFEQIRWSYQEDDTWRWFEPETLIDGRWDLTGRTTPINRTTGEAYTGATGYLDESLVPHFRYCRRPALRVDTG